MHFFDMNDIKNQKITFDFSGYSDNYIDTDSYTSYFPIKSYFLNRHHQCPNILKVLPIHDSRLNNLMPLLYFNFSKFMNECLSLRENRPNLNIKRIWSANCLHKGLIDGFYGDTNYELYFYIGDCFEVTLKQKNELALKIFFEIQKDKDLSIEFFKQYEGNIFCKYFVIFYGQKSLFFVEQHLKRHLEEYIVHLSKLNEEVSSNFSEYQNNNIKVGYISLNQFDELCIIDAKILPNNLDNSELFKICYGEDFVNKDYPNLIDCFKNQQKGLFIFYGEPGTGKTYLIRKLISDLKNDKKFLLVNQSFLSEISTPRLFQFLYDYAKNNQSSNLVLILEDAEQLLLKNENFNLRSELLNLTDGLLNDILKIQIIITFNTSNHNLEKMKKEYLDGIFRKERLLFAKYFGKLKQSQIEDFFNFYNYLNEFKRLDIDKELSLANVYSILDSLKKQKSIKITEENLETIKTQTNVGFI